MRMKKFVVAPLVLSMAVAFTACGNSESETNDQPTATPTVEATTAPTDEPATAPTEEPSAAPTEEPATAPTEEPAADNSVMTYTEYIAAELDTPVVIETYVQAKQSWWDNKATVYTQDEDGAYFLYNMACSEEDYAKLVPGTKIKVSGYKSEWSGEVEVVDATFEIVEGNFIAGAVDVTSLLGSEELIKHQNEFVSFKGMTVEPSTDADGNEVAFLYNWDGSGSAEGNSDLYFNVSVNGSTYNFTVESYLCNNTTDVYKTVEGLQIGDVIDMEGFLYWYNGVNPHITSVTVAAAETDAPVVSDADVKSEGVMTYAEYIAAELDTPVVIETYVQAKQSWWDNKATVYTQDKDGAYFLYNMACSEEDYAKLVPGTKIKVTGYKSEWSGEVEVVDATFEIEDGNFVAAATDVTALLGSEELISHQNEFVAFTGMTVAPSTDAEGNEVAFLYNWDGSGTAEGNSDLYFNVSVNGATYNFTVESYLCNNTTDVYKTVEGLKIGDVIDMEGFLYWYNGVNPHITAITVK